MVITEVELLVVEKQPGQELVLLTVKTDAGIEGHSMGWGAKGGKRLAEEIAAVIVPEILGEDPINREYLTTKSIRPTAGVDTCPSPPTAPSTSRSGTSRPNRPVCPSTNSSAATGTG
jgi:hypothetical protein